MYKYRSDANLKITYSSTSRRLYRRLRGLSVNQILSNVREKVVNIIVLLSYGVRYWIKSHTHISLPWMQATFVNASQYPNLSTIVRNKIDRFRPKRGRKLELTKPSLRFYFIIVSPPIIVNQATTARKSSHVCV